MHQHLTCVGIKIRSTLEKVYFAFMRPIFKYACMVWNFLEAPCHESF